MIIIDATITSNKIGGFYLLLNDSLAIVLIYKKPKYFKSVDVVQYNEMVRQSEESSLAVLNNTSLDMLKKSHLFHKLKINEISKFEVVKNGNLPSEVTIMQGKGIDLNHLSSFISLPF